MSIFSSNKKCIIEENLHLGKLAKTDYLACDACLLWQHYYAWNYGKTHRGDKRPPDFLFKTAYQTVLKQTPASLKKKS